MIFYDQKDAFFYSSKINDAAIFSGFGTKNTPYSNLLSPYLLNSQWQTHSTNIKYVNKPNSDLSDNDGFITKEKGIYLIAKTADCVPLIFVDKKNLIIGISHQGWKGTLDKMAMKMVNELVDCGAEIDQLQVAIGPAICKKCYVVSSGLYIEFAKKFSLKGSDYHLDLKQINYQQLLTAGLKPEQIDLAQNCTFCEKELFYSYRRDKEEDKRMINFVVLK